MNWLPNGWAAGFGKRFLPMRQWLFPRITDYWDNQARNSIFEYSQMIGFSLQEKKEQALQEIRAAMYEHTAILNDEQLTYAAFIIADDIYKSANEISLFNLYISEYLEASAGTFYQILSQRGFSLHYLANNVYAGSAAQGMIRPLQFFRYFFLPAGIKYICPHEIALELMKRDGLTVQDYDANISAYLDEAHMVGDMVIEKCHDNNDHYFNLQIDGQKSFFAPSLARVGDPQVITVFRSQPPMAGTTCDVLFPGQSIDMGNAH